MKFVDVVAAIIYSNCKKKVFIARRADTAHQGGKWEFPGGKKESGETLEAALYRELEEELGVKINASFPFMKIEHDYGDKAVSLNFFTVCEYEGRLRGAEGQETAWFNIAELKTLPFPDANKPVIQKLLSDV